MAKRQKPSASSSRKEGKGKPRKRFALDESTSEEELELAIQRQRIVLQESVPQDPFSIEGDPSDPNNLLKTNMDVPNRLPLDMGNEVKANNELIRIVIDQPLKYKFFLTRLRHGSSIPSASLKAGFSTPQRVAQWIRQGVIDDSIEKDSFYSRLYWDVSRSTGTKVSELEEIMADEKPELWLSRGPGRYVTDMWQDQKSIGGGVKQAEAIEGPPKETDILKLPVQEGEIEGEVIDPNAAPVDDNDYAEALRIMQEAGVSPEQEEEGWIEALKIQAGEQLSEEELEVQEEDNKNISLGSNHLLLTEQERQAQSSQPC